MKIVNCIVERRFVTKKYEHINITLEATPDIETGNELIKKLDTEIVNYVNGVINNGN